MVGFVLGGWFVGGVGRSGVVVVGGGGFHLIVPVPLLLHKNTCHCTNGPHGRFPFPPCDLTTTRVAVAAAIAAIATVATVATVATANTTTLGGLLHAPHRHFKVLRPQQIKTVFQQSLRRPLLPKSSIPFVFVVDLLQFTHKPIQLAIETALRDDRPQQGHKHWNTQLRVPVRRRHFAQGVPKILAGDGHGTNGASRAFHDEFHQPQMNVVLASGNFVAGDFRDSSGHQADRTAQFLLLVGALGLWVPGSGGLQKTRPSSLKYRGHDVLDGGGMVLRLVARGSVGNPLTFRDHGTDQEFGQGHDDLQLFRTHQGLQQKRQDVVRLKDGQRHTGFGPFLGTFQHGHTHFFVLGPAQKTGRSLLRQQGGHHV